MKFRQNPVVLKDVWTSILCLGRTGCYCRYKHFIRKILLNHFLINVFSRCDTALLDLSEGSHQWLDWGHTSRTYPSSVLWMSVPSGVHENQPGCFSVKILSTIRSCGEIQHLWMQNCFGRWQPGSWEQSTSRLVQLISLSWLCQISVFAFQKTTLFGTW